MQVAVELNVEVLMKMYLLNPLKLQVEYSGSGTSKKHNGSKIAAHKLAI